MTLKQVLNFLEEKGIDKTISLYNYMDSITYVRFFFDGEKYYQESTNPDRPNLFSTYKRYYENEKDFLIHWLRNRYVFYEENNNDIASIFKELLDIVKEG